MSLLTRAGFVRYEVSGYAKSGEICRHNVNYWTFGDYLAIGAGAHGKVTAEDGIFRAARFANPERYMRAVEEGTDPYEDKRRVTEEELPFEFMLNALRLTAGVPKRLWTEHTGLSDDVIAGTVAALQRDGLWTTQPNRIGTSPRGFAFLSSVQEAFL